MVQPFFRKGKHMIGGKYHPVPRLTALIAKSGEVVLQQKSRFLRHYRQVGLAVVYLTVEKGDSTVADLTDLLPVNRYKIRFTAHYIRRKIKQRSVFCKRAVRKCWAR